VTGEQKQADPSMHDLHVQSLRQFAWMLVVIAPVLCGVAILTGEASLGFTLRYASVVQTAFVAIWLASRTRFAERRPEFLQFALTLVAAGGVVFSPTHETLPHKPYAMVAPMASFIFAVVAPVRPWLAYALAASTAVLYAIALQIAPNDQAVDPAGYAVMCWTMAWMGATFARNHRSLWHELESARRGALDATRLKSEFLANMSHEIRTPMTAILGFAEEVELELEKSPANAPMRAALATIRRNGAHLLSLINGILDLSKVEAGKMELLLEEGSIDALLDDVLNGVRPLAEARKNALQLIKPAPIGLARTDLTRLRQVLLNLMSNACKFTERGRVSLRAEKQVIDGERWTSFAVQDTGIGIKPAELERLFEPFVQADVSTTRKYGGTGLGLSITRILCEMLGGSLQVESTFGAGSTFTVLLPVRHPASTPPPA
jgi:signal transduction histidine kinase